MAEPKKPQDRKPKQGEIIIQGMKLRIAEDAKDDFELLDDLAAIQTSQEGGRFPRVLRRLVGDQYDAVMEHLRGANGRVSLKDGIRFVTDLVKELNPNS